MSFKQEGAAVVFKGAAVIPYAGKACWQAQKSLFAHQHSTPHAAKNMQALPAPTVTMTLLHNATAGDNGMPHDCESCKCRLGVHMLEHLYSVKHSSMLPGLPKTCRTRSTMFQVICVRWTGH